MMLRVLLLLALVVLLGGCPGGSPPPIDPAVLGALLEAAIAATLIADPRKLKRASAREPTHRAFFVTRRLIALHAERPSWFAPVRQDDLFARLRNELAQIDAFLDAKLGAKRKTGPLVPVRGGTGDTAPRHLDLVDVSRVRVGEAAGAAQVKARASQRTSDRVQRVIDIVWRAAALHRALWTPGADGRSATLSTIDLGEVLDRRLRSVERMNYNISETSALLGAAPRWDLRGARGPWKDGTRVRIIEYPRVPRFFEGVIGAANIGIGKSWWLSGDGRRLEWAILVRRPHSFAGAQWRFPDAIEAHFDPNPDQEDRYGAVFVPKAPATAAQIIDQLFDHGAVEKRDMWNRAWLWCDHAIAALHLEALLFAQRRRSPTGEADFNQLVADGIPSGRKPYVVLTDVVGDINARNEGLLLRDNDDPHFENLMVDVGDLQVGDQLIFWNSVIYSYITGGDWRLENALVMDAASSLTLAAKPRSGVSLEQVTLQGHGTDVRRLAPYRELIADHIRDGLLIAQRRIVQKVAQDPTATKVEIGTNTLIRWSPYEELTTAELSRPLRGELGATANVGAWWVRIPVSQFQQSIPIALQNLPKAIARPDPRGAGYREPPDTVFPIYVLFPVFEPKFSSKGKRSAWDAYLAARAAGPVPPPKLRAVEVDASIAPGLYYAGEGKPIPIVRPKAKR